MKFNIMQAIVIGIMVIPCLSSHSIPTHKSITSVAVKYLQEEEAKFSCYDRLDAILETGTKNEDTGDLPFGFEWGRWMFHFLPALGDSINMGEPDRDSEDPRRATSYCDSVDWGVPDSPECSFVLNEVFPNFGAGIVVRPALSILETKVNEHTSFAAIRDASDTSGSPSENGWQHLGYLIHLLEDLTSPAHARNDGHAHKPFLGLNDPDLLEKMEVEDSYEDSERYPAAPTGSLRGLIAFSSIEQAFMDLQLFVTRNFYSKDRVFDGVGPAVIGEDDDYFYSSCLPNFPCADGKRKIAYKGDRYRRYLKEHGIPDPQKATINSTIADEQWIELGPLAVKYAASLIEYYSDVASPLIEPCPSPVPTGLCGTSANWTCTQLTNTGPAVTHDSSVISKNGTKVAYMERSTLDDTSLLVADDDGLGPITLIADDLLFVVGARASLSEDGSKLAFPARPSTAVGNSVYVLDAIGVRELVPASLRPGLAPALSSNGTTVAFFVQPSIFGNKEIRAVDFVGTNARPLVEVCCQNVGGLSDPSINGSGTKVTFAFLRALVTLVTNDSPNWRFSLINSDGSGFVDPPISPPIGTAGVHQPVISDDGSTLVLATATNPARVFIASSAGVILRELDPIPLLGTNSLGLTADGSKLVYTSSGAVYIRNTNGTGIPVQITPLNTSTQSSISGDGTKVAFLSSADLTGTGSNTDGNLEVFVARAPVP